MHLGRASRVCSEGCRGRRGGVEFVQAVALNDLRFVLLQAAPTVFSNIFAMRG